MVNKELLSIQEFAEAAGVSKQAIYKRLNNQLKPFIQLVDGKKMLSNKALSEVYGVEVEQKFNHALNNQGQPNQPLDAVISMLQKELEAKNAQLEAKDRQIEELQAALKREQELHTSAQRLHDQAQQLHLSSIAQLGEPNSEEQPAVTVEEPPAKKGWFGKWKK
jgi:transcriptional regulator with XRE-family HTH domain